MEKQALAGRYALEERVGTGGMAEVFRARDTRLQRDVALKLFRPGTADGLERGSAEARLLAGLDHPGLVRVLDMDTGEETGDNAYLVMELVDGPDLGVLLRTGGPLGCEEVRLMALDLARTLQYIHSRGIVHRDIKPSNILTRQTDPTSGYFGYLLTDFGIARFFDGGRMTATGQVIGSAAYFSPEQARGDGVGQPSDIYSLGLVMIEALTGERPFPGTGVESALARLHRGPSIPHAAGPALSALLVSMTLDHPADRPDAADVVHTLVAMGPQKRADPRTTVLPSAAPPTAAISLPAGPGPLHSPESGDGGPDTSRLTQAVDATRPVAHPAGTYEADTYEADTYDAGTAVSAAGGYDRSAATPDLQPVVSPATEPARLDGSTASEASVRTVRPPVLAKPSPRRRRHVLPWLVSVLVVALVAAALWAFTASARDASPDIEPLPAVSGEPGEKLQELYDSVQR
ncbi:serine/threonine-protein kinase [Arthrobacter sp. MDT3-44]